MTRTRYARRKVSGSGLLVVLVAAVACSDPLRPAEVADVYVLERIGSDTVPAVSFENESVRVRVLADTLRLFADGTGMRTALIEYTSLGDDADAPTEAPLADALMFETDDGRIEIAFDCPDFASCIAPPHLIARPTATGLRADYALGSRVPLIYRALGS